MTALYLESSAALELALGQARAADVEAALATADLLVTSQLTVLEVARILGRVPAPAGPRARTAWAALRPRLGLVPVEVSLEEPLAQAFPREPVRTLDAIHLATAQRLRPEGEPFLLAALDVRVRENAAAWGFAVVP